MILVASPVPGANEALALGREARAAAWRAGKMRGELDRRLTRPVPEASPERGWALANRGRYALEWGSAEWDALMDALREVAPRTADAVDAAVWGTDL